MEHTTILRLPKVLERVGLKRSSIYRRVAEGTFPKPIKLGPRSVGWDALSIEQWIAARIAESRGTAA